MKSSNSSVRRNILYMVGLPPTSINKGNCVNEKLIDTQLDIALTSLPVCMHVCAHTHTHTHTHMRCWLWGIQQYLLSICFTLSLHLTQVSRLVISCLRQGRRQPVFERMRRGKSCFPGLSRDHRLRLCEQEGSGYLSVTGLWRRKLCHTTIG